MTFSRQTEAVDVHVTTLLINRQGQSPKIDTDKVLRSLSGTPAAPQSAGARGRGGRGGAGRKGQPSNARRSVQTDVKGERLAARQEKNVKAVDTWNSPQKQQPAPQPFKGKRAAPWAEVTPLLAAQKPQPQPQSKRQNPPRQQQQNVQPQQTPQPQNQPQSVPHPTAEGWAGVTQAALLAEQQQAPKQEQEQKIVSEETDFQPVVKTLHQPTKAAAWQVFDPHEVYDDKNAYRRLPADLKRSHIQKGAEKPPKQQQQQNEQQQQKRPQKQNSRQKGKKQQKQQPQHEQEQEQNVMQEQEQEQFVETVEQPAQQQQPEQPEQEENATVWGEIQKALNSAQPFDDRNQVRKLAPELRRSHVKAVTQEKPKNQKKEKQPRGNQKDKKNPKEKANNNQNKPVQNEQPIGVEQEKVVEETITPVNPVWASVAEDAPYDDSRDVRRLPPQLRRSHAPPKVAEEQKPEPKQKKNKNVEKNDKPKDRKKGGKNQNKEDKKLEALKPIVSSAWANLVIPEPKPKPEPQQQATSEQPKPEQTHEEPIVTIPKPTPELIAQPEPEVVQPQVEDEEQEQPHEAVPLSQPLPKDSPWLNLTVEKLTAPRQKPAPKPKLIPQPEPIKDVESPVQIEEELESMPEPAAPVEIEEEEVHEVEEVKSLAPPPAVVSVWATVKNEKAYDDKNDWRKTPADLRRTHVKQVSADDQQKDKQQQQQRRPKKENNNKKGKGKQNKQIPTQQPQSEPKEPEHVVENPVEEIPESQPAAPIKTIWATINTNTPYDDSRDMRKLPPELRRTHKKAAEPTSEEKRGKKGKKADRQNGKQPNQKPQPNQQQPVEEEVVEEEQVQPIEEPEQQQQQQQPKSPWALINTNAPYDDRRDVSRLPPELRRTHKQPQPAKQEEKGGNNNERQGRQQKQTGEQENQSGFAFKKLKRAEQPPPK
ncbi:hypothetical protein TRFO_18786 [Tritrichomonas foetus]|uniref:Uncharacterized protein n=1 Tax=Tritrichomonas foetus TaxID=1144522 RepID=A0A1J4KQK2_9EUKA|nr:hypothetical protein TRFO_18786 [Tritrichomonas foetus]|eukprot:OHT11717.1 hypothetical protein TRFO_18786 [Tritrichomonas foetus]